MDDRNGSTTPPLPPPEPSETQPPQQSSGTLQPQEESSQSPPTSAQEDRPVEPAEGKCHDARMDGSPQQSRLPRRTNMSTPEPRQITIGKSQTNINPNAQTNGQGSHGNVANINLAAHLDPARSSTPDTPGTVGTIPSFDWDDLEVRFEKALADVNEHEQGLMAEFGALVNVDNPIVHHMDPADQGSSILMSGLLLHLRTTMSAQPSGNFTQPTWNAW